MSERLSDTAISIVNELHTERLDYNSEYIPLIDALNKLAEYEDVEEAGRLAILPCKIGDTVFMIDDDGLHEYDVVGFAIENYNIIVELWGTSISVTKKWVNAKEFGKTVFFTPEEAEAALKGTKK